MQILGIYLESADDKIKKRLKNDSWYGINISENLHELYEPGKLLNFESQFKKGKKFTKQLYNLTYTNTELSLNAIVGKNGSGKSTLLEIQNIIINNFSFEMKKKFKDYNKGYKILQINGIKAEMYYEIENIIYRIKIDNTTVEFSSENDADLFAKITTLKELSSYTFYTITSNYSIYVDYPKWKEKLYHKNDGYFTPIVLVPYRLNGDIEMSREKKLAEKRVQTLSLLAYKDEADFIENYIPYKIVYSIQDLKTYKKNIEEKTDELCKSHYTTFYKQYPKKYQIYYDYIATNINRFWKDYFTKNFTNFRLKEYCQEYLIYKTIKVFLNYESIFNTLELEKYNGNINFYDSIKKTIEKELLEESNINYINLKILMCIKFMKSTYKKLYKSKIQNEIKIKNFIKMDLVQNAKTYDEMFVLLLPDFFDWHFFYQYNPVNDESKENKKGQIIMELTDMSSGEQQLYSTLSYIIYHIKNAQSNKIGNQKGKIPYNYFNVVFDEAELYYHPEYQRRFINDIIKIFNRSNLGIKGINFTLVTHSPFILSDIPRENILELEEGVVSEKLNETLGANIYDLLENQFFMSSTIGESSRFMIERIINSFKSEEPISNDDLDFYDIFIQKIGDVYLKNALKEMVDSKRNIKFLDRKINYYENIVNNLKKQKMAYPNEKN